MTDLDNGRAHLDPFLVSRETATIIDCAKLYYSEAILELCEHICEQFNARHENAVLVGFDKPSSADLVDAKGRKAAFVAALIEPDKTDERLAYLDGIANQLRVPVWAVCFEGCGLRRAVEDNRPYLAFTHIDTSPGTWALLRSVDTSMRQAEGITYRMLVDGRDTTPWYLFDQFQVRTFANVVPAGAR
jgi:hypothetical protein